MSEKSPLEPTPFQPPSYREVPISASEEMAYAEKPSIDTARALEKMENGVDVVHAVLLDAASRVEAQRDRDMGDSAENSGYEHGIDIANNLLKDRSVAESIVRGSLYEEADDASKKIYEEHVDSLRSQHAIEEQGKAVKRFAAELGLDANNLTPEQEGLILQKVNLEISTHEEPANNPDGSPGRPPMPMGYNGDDPDEWD